MDKKNSLKQDWDDLAELDAYWAVITSKNKQGNAWGTEEFFRTGEVEINQLLEEIKPLKPNLALNRALDFGCGLGRLTSPLSRIFDEAYGVDISPVMIKKSRELSSRDNCYFSVNPDDSLRQFKDGYFDLIYTNIVLQHIPDRTMILNYITEFIRVLDSNGLLVFQLPGDIKFIYKLKPRIRLYHLLKALGFRKDFLYNKLRLYPMTMNFIPKDNVISHLRENGCKVLSVKEVGHENYKYIVTKNPA